MKLNIEGQDFIRNQAKSRENVLFLSSMRNGKSYDERKLSAYKNKQLVFVAVTPNAKTQELIRHVAKTDLISAKSKAQIPTDASSDLSDLYKLFPNNSVFEIMCFIEGHLEEYGITQEYLFTLLIRKTK